MRIGELAAVAGVTTRTVRHYHRIGVLPEPERDGAGYRRYGLADAVRLLRIRRLAGLGLSLDEAGDALDDGSGRGAREMLTDLDADLVAQQRRIAEQRDRIAALLASDGDPAEPPEAEHTWQVLREIGGEAPGLDREHLIMRLASDVAGPDVWPMYRKVLADHDLTGDMLAALARFEALAGLDPHDPAVDELAADAAGFGDAIASLLPTPDPATPDLPASGSPVSGLAVTAGPGRGPESCDRVERDRVDSGTNASDPDAARRLLNAIAADLGPAQARCLEMLTDAWRGAGP